MSTYMWRETSNSKEWRLQTDDTKLILKLNRSVRFTPAAWSLNTKFKVFRFSPESQRNALRTFKRITGQDPIFNAVEGVFFEKSRPSRHVKPESRLEFELQK